MSDKPTIVLVHGFWGGAAHWNKVIAGDGHHLESATGQHLRRHHYHCGVEEEAVVVSGFHR
ncbi:hypothetical protein [Pseudomonas sp. F01002]|uniref:hypothetical protein n=1 Tax=Pseudomonas sp. F01002 TaxID=2555724 RepID=UPI0035326F95